MAPAHHSPEATRTKAIRQADLSLSQPLESVAAAAATWHAVRTLGLCIKIPAHQY